MEIPLDKLQLALFFITGFFISRLVIKIRFPEKLVHYLLTRAMLSFSGVILVLIVSAAGLSFFIPNAITVLTLLPVLEIIRKMYEKDISKDHSIAIQKKSATVLGLALVYGANIGGMGSITASPANGILVGFATMQKLPGLVNLNFATWLFWAIPLVVVFVMVAWLFLRFFFQTYKFPKWDQDSGIRTIETYHPQQKIGLIITLFYFFSALILSVFINTFPNQMLAIVIVSITTSLGIWIVLFIIPLPAGPTKNRLLTIPDCYSNLPAKGFLFVGIVIVLGAIAYFLGAGTWVASLISQSLPAQMPIWLLFFIFALLTSFATEILSNTVIQVAMFGLAMQIAQVTPVSVLQLSLVITLSCTSAFMSPIATGVNGLAFGGVKNFRLLDMLMAGAIMNTIGALLISTWIYIFTQG